MSVYRCEYCDEMRDKDECPPYEWDDRLACEPCWDEMDRIAALREDARGKDGE